MRSRHAACYAQGMSRVQMTSRFTALALATVLIAACLVAPAVVAPSAGAGAPAVVSSAMLASAATHALRGDDGGQHVRSQAVAWPGLVLIHAFAGLTAPTVAPALIATPGSFERPLRI